MSTRTAIEVVVNGDPRALEDEATIADLLRSMDLDPSHPKGIAVAVNDEVVPKSEWGSAALSDGDRVEVITARQGG